MPYHYLLAQSLKQKANQLMIQIQHLLMSLFGLILRAFSKNVNASSYLFAFAISSPFFTNSFEASFLLSLRIFGFLGEDPLESRLNIESKIIEERHHETRSYPQKLHRNLQGLD